MKWPISIEYFPEQNQNLAPDRQCDLAKKWEYFLNVSVCIFRGLLVLIKWNYKLLSQMRFSCYSIHLQCFLLCIWLNYSQSKENGCSFTVFLNQAWSMHIPCSENSFTCKCHINTNNCQAENLSLLSTDTKDKYQATNFVQLEVRTTALNSRFRELRN